MGTRIHWLLSGAMLAAGLTVLPAVPALLVFAGFVALALRAAPEGRQRVAAVFGLVLLSLVVRITLFPLEFETRGEMEGEYRSRIVAGQLPVTDMPGGVLPVVGSEPHAYSLMQLAAGGAGLDPTLTVKGVRALLGLLGTLWVLRIGWLATRRWDSAVAGSLIYAVYFLEFWYVGGDQFKNLAGEIFLLAFFSEWMEERPRVGLCVLFGLSAALSHRIYLLFIPATVVAHVLILPATRRWRNAGIPVASTVVILFVAAFAVQVPALREALQRANLPMLFAEGLDPRGLSLTPGVLLHTTWWLAVTVTALVLLRRDIVERPGIHMILLAFQMAFLGSRTMLLGSGVSPDRILLLTGPFVALLTGFAAAEAGRRWFPRLRTLPVAGVVLAVVALGAWAMQRGDMRHIELTEWATSTASEHATRVFGDSDWNPFDQASRIVLGLLVAFACGAGVLRREEPSSALTALMLGMAVLLAASVAAQVACREGLLDRGSVHLWTVTVALGFSAAAVAARSLRRAPV